MNGDDGRRRRALGTPLVWLLGLATLSAVLGARAQADPVVIAAASASGRAAVGAPGAIVQEGPADRQRRRRLSERPEDERPEEQRGLLLFGRPLIIGGELGVRGDYDLDPRLGTRADDRARITPEVELELFYPPSDLVSLYAEVKYEFRRQLQGGDGADEKHHLLRRGETWIHAADPAELGLAVQAGRQNLRDARRWWWDEDLDAIRLLLDRSRFDAELAIAREMLPVDLLELEIDPEERGVLRLLGRASLRYARRQRIEIFGLHQRDRSSAGSLGRRVREDREDETDADLDWLGLRARGRFEGERLALHYILGCAAVRGEATLVDYSGAGDGYSTVEEIARRDVSGWAAEGWLTLESALPRRPSLTLGYAVGSGSGDAESGRAFRQTGLHRNDGRFRGVTSFRYYGELLDPELSNLHIATVGLGAHVTDSDSIDLVYHRYRQHRSAPALRASGIRLAPEGRRAAIGDELDLVIGIGSWEHRRIELVGSAFRAGAAYGELRDEFSFEAGFKFEVAF